MIYLEFNKKWTLGGEQEGWRSRSHLCINLHHWRIVGWDTYSSYGFTEVD
ncbi:MAG TPA: hypothetical protein V6D27_06550 [Vampirovibrionales bacterium]